MLSNFFEIFCALTISNAKHQTTSNAKYQTIIENYD